ncbi:hypothetical protein [Nonomuraea sp. NPDC049480]|uniref:hypothetical protein n=1 Tax=Nonomuraea sp. NPDC049480 TaxID=3364353 RepID=UPI0037A0167F
MDLPDDAKTPTGERCGVDEGSINVRQMSGCCPPRRPARSATPPATCARRRTWWCCSDGADHGRLGLSTGLQAAHRQRTGRRRRHPAHSRARYWQVRDKSSGRGYQIHPGEFDGTADAYGVSDLWFLRHHPRELDDGNPGPRDRAAINRWLNGENINGANVVVWYAGHYFHDQAHPHAHQGELIGPRLSLI